MLYKLDPIAPGIACVETADSGQIAVVRHSESTRQQPGSQRFEVDGRKGSVGLPRRPEIRLDTNVDLVPSAAKPTASLLLELLRFLNLIQSENTPIKPAGIILTPRRCSNLDVMEGEVNRPHDIEITSQSPMNAIAREFVGARKASRGVSTLVNRSAGATVHSY